MQSAADSSASIQAIQSHAEGSLGAAQRAVEQVRAASVALRGIENIARSIPATTEMVGEVAEHANFVALNAMLEALRGSQAEGGPAAVAPAVEALSDQCMRTMAALTEIAGTVARMEAEPEPAPADAAAADETQGLDGEVHLFFERLNLA